MRLPNWRDSTAALVVLVAGTLLAMLGIVFVNALNDRADAQDALLAALRAERRQAVQVVELRDQIRRLVDKVDELEAGNRRLARQVRGLGGEPVVIIQPPPTPTLSPNPNTQGRAGPATTPTTEKPGKKRASLSTAGVYCKEPPNAMAATHRPIHRGRGPSGRNACHRTGRPDR